VCVVPPDSSPRRQGNPPTDIQRPILPGGVGHLTVHRDVIGLGGVGDGDGQAVGKRGRLLQAGTLAWTGGDHAGQREIGLRAGCECDVIHPQGLIADTGAEDGAGLPGSGRRCHLATNESPVIGIGVQWCDQLRRAQRRPGCVQPHDVDAVTGLKFLPDVHLHQRRRAHGVSDIAGAAEEPGGETVTPAGGDGDGFAGVACHGRGREGVGEGQGVIPAVGGGKDGAHPQTLIEGFGPVVESRLEAGVEHQVGADHLPGLAEVAQDEGRRRCRGQLLTVDLQAGYLSVGGEREGKAIGRGQRVVGRRLGLPGEHRTQDQDQQNCQSDGRHQTGIHNNSLLSLLLLRPASASESNELPACYCETR